MNSECGRALCGAWYTGRVSHLAGVCDASRHAVHIRVDQPHIQPSLEAQAPVQQDPLAGSTDS
jgi:hypothetical protein